jgi:hypothetical protein
MNLQQRIDLLVRLGEYMSGNSEEWLEAKEKAKRENGWFILPFIDLSVKNICEQFLQREKLEQWTAAYPLQNIKEPKNVGLVMAGNLPLVGFHDFLCVFISGHMVTIKPSSKDEVLIKHLVRKLYEWEITVQNYISLAENLKGCDAYIATGSNNSSRYFEYYFAKYPHIIRKNRTSVAVLTGEESSEQLDRLTDDVVTYFGLGCRNVTKIYVPHNYDFIPLLQAFRKYEWLGDENKYRNNYDYQLALLIMNNKTYMTNPAIILSERPEIFSAVSQLHYEYYTNKDQVIAELKNNNEIQCTIGYEGLPFGSAQTPSLTDYADGIDVMKFLSEI